MSKKSERGDASGFASFLQMVTECLVARGVSRSWALVLVRADTRWLEGKYPNISVEQAAEGVFDEERPSDIAEYEVRVALFLEEYGLNRDVSDSLVRDNKPAVELAARGHLHPWAVAAQLLTQVRMNKPPEVRPPAVGTESTIRLAPAIEGPLQELTRLGLLGDSVEAVAQVLIGQALIGHMKDGVIAPRRGRTE